MTVNTAMKKDCGKMKRNREIERMIREIILYGVSNADFCLTEDEIKENTKPYYNRGAILITWRKT